MKNIGIQTEMIMTKEVQEAAKSSHSIDKETQTKSPEQSSTSSNADIQELSPAVPGIKRKWTSLPELSNKKATEHMGYQTVAKVPIYGVLQNDSILQRRPRKVAH